MLITTCLKPISTEADYQQALARVEAIFEARPGTPEFGELGILGPLVYDYEAQHYPMPEPAAK
jgi:HTH-type transcriptional regulator/antitoxin HigA